MQFDAPFIAIRSFFEAGGDVLWAIFAVTMLMWSLTPTCPAMTT